jgi:cellulose synthase/poly-beta-1,6-N-acetylglucosamine synthase-like glycosyltransferase
VSILVPAWCEHGTIEKCIRSLQAIDYPSWEALILAGGPDGTYETACQIVSGDSRFRVIERGPEPKNVALTRGIRVAQHDALVLLDADSVVERGWLTALIAPLVSGAAASFGMHYPANMTWISMAEHMDVFQAYHTLGAKLAQGCSSLAIWREKLEQIGPLPANAFSWEDWDIAVKLVDAGEQITFAPDARLVTSRPATLKEFWDNAVRCYTSHLAALWHHRAVFIRQPLWAARELYLTGFSVALAFAAGVGAITALTEPSKTGTIVKAAALVALWIAGRRAALSAEIAAYTGEPRWLLRAWAPVVVLPVQFAAAIMAPLRVRRQPSFDYKGPRNLQPSGTDGVSWSPDDQATVRT